MIVDWLEPDPQLIKSLLHGVNPAIVIKVLAEVYDEQTKHIVSSCHEANGLCKPCTQLVTLYKHVAASLELVADDVTAKETNIAKLYTKT